MACIGIALFFSLFVCCIALRANASFWNVERLPMQWSLTGQVTWSAPKPVALAFLPVLTACIFVALCFLLLNLKPRPGQENMELPVFIGFGVMSVGIQLLHLWLAARTVRRDGC